MLCTQQCCLSLGSVHSCAALLGKCKLLWTRLSYDIIISDFYYLSRRHLAQWEGTCVSGLSIPSAALVHRIAFCRAIIRYTISLFDSVALLVQQACVPPMLMSHHIQIFKLDSLSYVRRSFILQTDDDTRRYDKEWWSTVLVLHGLRDGNARAQCILYKMFAFK